MYVTFCLNLLETVARPPGGFAPGPTVWFSTSLTHKSSRGIVQTSHVGEGTSPCSSPYLPLPFPSTHPIQITTAPLRSIAACVKLFNVWLTSLVFRKKYTHNSSSVWFSQTTQHYRPPRTFRILLLEKLLFNGNMPLPYFSTWKRLTIVHGSTAS